MLTAPHLDDRHFQDLVDEAKRLVQQRCPEWTDHNVSDPGVTLIETFAYMVDQLIYRLNRVPERNYVKFLELIGVELRPPAAARGAVTFWLSAPQPQTVLVRAETEVATARTDIHDPVVFTTSRDLRIIPCEFSRSAVLSAAGEVTETTTMMLSREGLPGFTARPTPGDALLVGLSDAVPSCAVLLRMDCAVAGHGVDPRDPPLVWEAWTAAGWAPCDLERDETGGLNQPGDIVLHVPTGHTASVLARQRAGWIRCRLVETEEEAPTYTAPPRIRSVTAFTVGGTAPMEHAQVVRGEELGRSDGTPGQRLELQRRPVLHADEAVNLEVISGDTVQEWSEVSDFAGSGPEDRHFRVDLSAGEVQLGPAVRLETGGLRHYGAVPTTGSRIRIVLYRTGGGAAGNIATGQIRVLKSSVPYVSRVENRAPAVGGAGAESLEDAKIRGPLLLRSRGRAVTAEDIEGLAREAAPDVARVHCVPAFAEEDAGGIRVLVVPHVSTDQVGRILRGDLTPPDAVLQRISDTLDRHRLVGTRLLVTPPEYVWLTAVVSAHALPRHDPDEVQQAVLASLYQLFNPLTGGPEGTGWPFGRSIQAHEVHAALARTPGVDMAEELGVSIYPATPDATAAPGSRARRGAVVQRLELPPTALVYSYDHQVRVQ